MARAHLALFVLSLSLVALPVQAQRARCGSPERDPSLLSGSRAPSDCGYLTNSPQPEYEPSFFYDIPVVFHVIQDSSGEGFLSAATLQDQIDILNEDWQAIPGSPGGPGNNAMIRFHLATVDPAGNPTTGITYSTNNSWFQDSGSYWNSLAWDTNRYLNIYTNAVPCCYGYVSGFPAQGGFVGQANDRVVLWWEAVGRDPTVGWPLNMGRTATHEVGHYLGLYHTFCGGCGSASACDTTGDLICDTNGESTATLGCPGSKSSCGSPDPIHNYMDYTDDPCLWEFTPEQINRMRCTLENWRTDLSVPPQVGTWTDLGGGSPGVAGVPQLVMSGDQTAGSLVTANLSQAGNGSLLLLWLAFASTPTPMVGGTLHSFPFANQILVAADGAGSFSASAPWSSGVPAGTQAWWQFVCEDTSTVYEVTLSNGVRSTAP